MRIIFNFIFYYLYSILNYTKTTIKFSINILIHKQNFIDKKCLFRVLYNTFRSNYIMSMMSKHDIRFKSLLKEIAIGIYNKNKDQ